MPDWLLSLLTALTTAYLVSQWTVHGAFRQKWWPRKAQAYDEIIEALQSNIAYFRTAGSLLARQLSDEPDERRLQQFSESVVVLTKAVEKGDFYVTEKTALTVDQYARRAMRSFVDVENAEDGWAIAQALAKQGEQALRTVRRCARRELNPPSLVENLQWWFAVLCDALNSCWMWLQAKIKELEDEDVRNASN